MSVRTQVIVSAVVAVVLLAAAGLGWSQASSAKSGRSKDAAAFSETEIALRVQLRQANRDLKEAQNQLQAASDEVSTLDAKVSGKDATSLATKRELQKASDALKARSTDL